MTSNTIDWETLAKSSKPRRTMGKIKLGLPQRGFIFDTPREGSSGSDASNEPAALRRVPFRLQETDENQDIHEGVRASSDYKLSTSSASASTSSIRRRDQSLSPVLPRLKTFDTQSFVSNLSTSVNNSTLNGHRLQPRSSSCFETPQPTRVLHNSSAAHPPIAEVNRHNSSYVSFRTTSHPRNTPSGMTNDINVGVGTHGPDGRQRHVSRSPLRKTVSSPSLLKMRPEMPHHHHAATLSPLKEQNTPIPSRPRTSIPAVPKGLFTINGKNYTLLEKIGSGGSSEVFRALDESNSFKAIKQVNLSEVSAEDARLFRNEVQMLMRFKDQRRIVQVDDFAEVRTADGKEFLYVVMEHGEKDLAHLLKEYSSAGGGGLTDIKVKFYWEEMLEAVQVAHTHGIIHLDLKPANFLIVGGTVKLIDFGIASKVDSDRTHVTKDTQLGTLNFMSPEAIQDQSTPGNGGSGRPIIKISYKSDVWSLGCILYNLVYGRLPFSHIRNPYQKICSIADPNHKIEFPLAGQHDPQVVDVLQRCLVRDPAQRASIEELLQHPYLRNTAAAASGASQHLSVPGMSSAANGKSSNVQDLLAAFSTLTPNSKKMLVTKLNLKE